MSHSILDYFSSMRVLVIGDVMLDQYTYGETPRISPEAPVPIFHTKSSTFFLGGASNVANNTRALGAKTKLIGVVGSDAGATTLLALLERADIDRSGVMVDPSRSTTVKNRILAQGKQLIRFDYECTDPLNVEVEQRVLSVLEERISESSVLVLSDYAKGVLSEKIVTHCIERARHHKIPVVADIKPKYVDRYCGVYAVTPNLKEAVEITGVADPIRAAQALSVRLETNACVTCGAAGIVLAEKGGTVTSFPATHTAPVDVSGAGDTVVAVLALASAAGAPLTECVRMANCAGGLVVRKSGTATLTKIELMGIL